MPEECQPQGRVRGHGAPAPGRVVGCAHQHTGEAVKRPSALTSPAPYHDMWTPSEQLPTSDLGPLALGRLISEISRNPGDEWPGPAGTTKSDFVLPFCHDQCLRGESRSSLGVPLGK